MSDILAVEHQTETFRQVLSNRCLSRTIRAKEDYENSSWMKPTLSQANALIDKVPNQFDRIPFQGC